MKPHGLLRKIRVFRHTFPQIFIKILKIITKHYQTLQNYAIIKP